MAEEGGGGHSDGGSSSSVGSTQRLPLQPPPQAPQPGSQAPPAPALAPDQLPQNNTLVALPIIAIENILSFMSYDEISQLRLVRPAGPRRCPPGRGLGRDGDGRFPRAAAGARVDPESPDAHRRRWPRFRRCFGGGHRQGFSAWEGSAGGGRGASPAAGLRAAQRGSPGLCVPLAGPAGRGRRRKQRDPGLSPASPDGPEKRAAGAPDPAEIIGTQAPVVF